MRCYICNSMTDYIDKQDNKPICYDCRTEIYYSLAILELEMELHEGGNDQPIEQDFIPRQEYSYWVCPMPKLSDEWSGHDW